MPGTHTHTDTHVLTESHTTAAQLVLADVTGIREGGRRVWLSSSSFKIVPDLQFMCMCTHTHIHTLNKVGQG